MTRRRIVTSEEQDIHTGWRRYLKYLRRKGELRRAKRRSVRRQRREAQRETQRLIREETQG